MPCSVLRRPDRSSLAPRRTAWNQFPHMTEPATPHPFLTRRRVIAGALGMLVMVVVMGWCGWMMFGRYEGPLAVVFGQFEPRQSQTGWEAKVYLTNISNTATCRLYYA